jgi:hypothetical protein
MYDTEFPFGEDMREYAAVLSASPITPDTVFRSTEAGDTIRSSVYHALKHTLEQVQPTAVLQTEAVYQIFNIIRAVSFS